MALALTWPTCMWENHPVPTGFRVRKVPLHNRSDDATQEADAYEGLPAAHAMTARLGLC